MIRTYQMKKILLIALFLCSPSARLYAEKASSQKSEWDARITSVKGTVQVLLAGSGDGEAIDAEAIDAEADMPLSIGDRVKTGDDGHVEIALKEDGALKAGPSSSIKINSLEKDDTFFDLDIGYIIAKIKLMMRRRLRIRTPTSVTAVRGTEFGVEVDNTENRTVVGVYDEGQVAVESLEGEGSGAPQLLNTNEETDVYRGRSPEPPRALTALRKRFEQVQQLRGRQAFLKKQYKKYARQNRDRLRKRMEKTRANIREKIKKKSDRIHKRGKGGLDRMKKNRERFEKGLRRGHKRP